MYLFPHKYLVELIHYYLNQLAVTFLSFFSKKKRTSKTGKLPNILYIYQKSEPLGTVFKCVVDSFLGVILWMDIQEEKDMMREKEFSELGGTVACTIRGVKATRELKELPVDNLSVDEPKRFFMETVGLIHSRQYPILLRLVIMLL